MERPSILEAVERKRLRETSLQTTLARVSKPAKDGVIAARETVAALAPSREGKINVSAYFPSEVKSSLRLVQAKRGGKVQDLLAEALNLLFAKYSVPETAPVETRTE